jgi:predicted nucleic acid-binding protein
MVLVDTSIWIDHFLNSNQELKELLIAGQVCVHPFVLGELSCGNISNRKEIITLLRALPRIETVLDEEVFVLIEDNKLYGKGLGFIDVHLLSSAMIHHVSIWTGDRHLHRISKEFGIGGSRS